MTDQLLNELPAHAHRSSFVDFFVWWGDELRGLFSRTDTGAGETTHDPVRLTAGKSSFQVDRLLANGSERELIYESGRPDQLRASRKLKRRLSMAGSVELVAAQDIANVQHFKLPRSAGPDAADALKDEIRASLPSKDGAVFIGFRVTPDKAGGASLDFAAAHSGQVQPWLDRIKELEKPVRFGGIAADSELIPSLSPAGQAPLPARLEDRPESESRSAAGVMVVIGVLVAAVFLAFGIYQNRENASSMQADVPQAETTDGLDLKKEIAALDAEFDVLKLRRGAIQSLAQPVAASSVLGMLADSLPRPTAVTEIALDGTSLRVSGETPQPNLLAEKLQDESRLGSISVETPVDSWDGVVARSFVLRATLGAAVTIPGDDLDESTASEEIQP